MPFLHPVFIIAILLAVAFHECAHAWAAKRLGDPTAEHEGRLTLNPLAHLDLLGALMFVVVGFGWAKPVPVNPAFFRHPHRDNALVAVAGPLSNILLAFGALLVLDVVFREQSIVFFDLPFAPRGQLLPLFLLHLLRSLVYVNLGLAAFNLLPIAPLDGSRVLPMLLPRRWQWQYESWMRHGPIVLLLVILFESFLPVPILSFWVGSVAEGILRALLFFLSPLSG